MLDCCLAGLLEVDEVRQRLEAGRSQFETYTVTREDVLRSLRILQVLGNGFSVLSLNSPSGSKLLVQSVPGETNPDHTAVLEAAAAAPVGVVTCSALQDRFGWTAERANINLEHFVKEGVAWIDAPPGKASQPAYWFPCLFQGNLGSPTKASASH